MFSVRDLSLGHTSLSFGYPNEGSWLSRLVALPCRLSPYFTYGYAYKNTSYIIFYRVFIARTSIYETNLIIILLI